MKDEISMYEVLQIFLSRWKYLLAITLLCVLFAIVKHKNFPSYPAQGRLLIKTSENSELRSFLSNIVGNQQNSNPAERALLRLNTNRFFLKLAKAVPAEQIPKTTRDIFKANNHNPQFIADYIRSMINFRLADGGQILITSRTPKKMLSLILVNSSLKLAKDFLINHELQEYIEAEAYFKNEIKLTLDNLEKLSQTSVSKMKKGNVLSIDTERGESSKYLQRLSQQINDAKIQISKNIALIKTLSKSKPESSKSNFSKFGTESRIKQLRDENKDLKIQIKSNQQYLSKIGKSKLKLVPFQQEIEKIKANYHFEFKIYEGLRDKLAKIGLQKTYISNKIEILEFERAAKVKSRPGIFMLILIGIMLGNTIGFIGIYLIELFKPTDKTSSP